MPRFITILTAWLPFALCSLIGISFAYIGIQQEMRQSANDPQIQLAEDAATSIEKGTSPSTVIPKETVDPSTSLAPFVVVTDLAGTVISGSGTLSGKTPVPPHDSLVVATGTSENRITWQPEGGVRLAAVIRHFGGERPGYVIAARSLREVENRENDLTIMAGIAMFISLGGSLLFIFLRRPEAKRLAKLKL
ncbi:MAG: hypothetical protein WCO52_02265 [bacterium]